MAIPKSFGAVELAKYCQVSRNTIHNWIRDGKLKAFKLPGGHYRVEKKELLKFLQHYEMPVPDELLQEEPKKKVLLVNGAADSVEAVTQILEKVSDNLYVEVANSGIEACLKVGTFLPELVIIDIDSSMDVCKEIKKNEVTAHTKIIVIADANSADSFKEIGVDSFISRPMEAKTLEKEAKKIVA